MCQCTPEIKTPFCGRPGCEWPPQTPSKLPDPIRLYRELTPLRHIKRFQQHSCISPISVLEHSALVAFMSGAMATQLRQHGVACHRPAVIEGALWHDAAEAVTGDIPAPVKWAFKDLREPLGDAADLVLRHLARDSGCPDSDNIVPGTGTLEKLVIKCADFVELLLYVREEQAAGNHTLDYPAVRIWELLTQGWVAQAFVTHTHTGVRTWWDAFSLGLGRLHPAHPDPWDSRSGRSVFGLP